MKADLILRSQAIWALVVVYVVFATVYGVNGQLFIGVVLGLGTLAGVSLAAPKIAGVLAKKGGD